MPILIEKKAALYPPPAATSKKPATSRRNQKGQARPQRPRAPPHAATSRPQTSLPDPICTRLTVGATAAGWAPPTACPRSPSCVVKCVGLTSDLTPSALKRWSGDGSGFRRPDAQRRFAPGQREFAALEPPAIGVFRTPSGERIARAPRRRPQSARLATQALSGPAQRRYPPV